MAVKVKIEQTCAEGFSRTLEHVGTLVFHIFFGHYILINLRPP